MYDELETMLSRRTVLPPSDDLSERIIAEALRRPRREKIGLAELWDSFFDLFLLPQPAFILSIFLVSGVTFGFNNHIQSLYTDARDEMVSAYSFAADNSYDEGNFL